MILMGGWIVILVLVLAVLALVYRCFFWRDGSSSTDQGSSLRAAPPPPPATTSSRDATLRHRPMATGTGGPGPDIEHLMNKEPILSDLVNWLNDVRDEWANLGRHLGVSEADIRSIPEYRQNADKLASILNTWKTGMTSHHTIKKLLDVLKLMGKTEVVKKIREDLQKPEVAATYLKQPDYRPYEE